MQQFRLRNHLSFLVLNFVNRLICGLVLLEVSRKLLVIFKLVHISKVVKPFCS